MLKTIPAKRQLPVNPAALLRRIEDFFLASSQLRYVESQVALPLDEEIMAEISSRQERSTRPDDAKLYNEIRNQILKERLSDTVKNWLHMIVKSANVRILK